MRAPRPLQVPWQVGVPASLHALLGDVPQPLFARENAIEGIRLENAENQEGSDAPNDQVNGDQFPVIRGKEALALGAIPD